MKTLVSAFGGAVQIQEQALDIYLVFDASIGGGAASGIVEGSGKIKIGSGSVGLKLGEAWLNAHAPASVQPFLIAAEAMINPAVAAL